MIDFRSLQYNELMSYLSGKKVPSYTAKQLFSWLHKNPVSDFSEMTNLKKSFREELEKEGFLTTLKVKKVEESQDGTKKILWELSDGNFIESVYMVHNYGNSLCLSTQVGCRMGCRFCASTIGGLVRSLAPSEMLSEVYEAERLTKTTLSNIVLMGSGEPLDNYENVISFLKILSDPLGRNMSLRNVTLSTCGLPDKIHALALENMPLTLAISLHAPNDTIRKELLPIAFRYSIREVIKEADFYFKKTGRRVSYEYALTLGINDGPENAMALAALLKGKDAHVNLIAVNPVSERDFTKPSYENIREFQNILEKSGINATIRKGMGKDINGACGQLRYKTMHEGEKV